MVNVIEIVGVKKKYGKNFALNGIDVVVPKQSICGFIGKNGAGKTTLIRILCGLQKANEGKISIESTTIGALIESPSFYKDMTARENMMQQFRICGIEDFSKIDELLKLVGLEDTALKKVKKFSLGMKQKLGLAMALVGDPELLILDEPINGLDPQGIIDFRNLIIKLNKEKGITFFISSHILEEMTKFCTNYIFINDGLIVKSMTNEELQGECQEFLNVEVSDLNALEKVLLNNNWNYSITGDKTARIFADILITDFVMELNEYNCKLLMFLFKDYLEEFYLI